MRTSISAGLSREGPNGPRVVLVTLLALLAVPARGHAVDGGLTQLPAPQGCISHDGSGPCTDADQLFGPFAIATTNDGRHAYVALIDSRAVAALARDKKTGALTQLPSPAGCVSNGGAIPLCAEGRGLHAPISVAVSPDGKNVYFTSFQKDPVSISAVTAFSRNAKTGALTQLAGEQGCISEDSGAGACAKGTAVRGARAIAVSKDGAHVYGASEGSDAVAVFARDRGTGALTQLPEPHGCVSRDGSGGHCTPGVALDDPNGVAISKDGKHVYVASERDGAVAVFARDKKTGVLTQLPGNRGCISDDGSGGSCIDGDGLGAPESIAVSPRGTQVYVASPGTDQVAILRRDKKTGALSQLPPPYGCVSADGSEGVCTQGVGMRAPYSVAVSPSSKRVYVAAKDDGAVAVFAHDKKTGRLTQLPSTEACISDDGSEGLCSDGRGLRLPRSVVVSKDGKHVYVAAQTSAAIAVLQPEK